MNLQFKGCAITGQLLIVPENERTFLEDMKTFNFSEARSLKLKAVMGYDKHRVVKDGTCVSDLVAAGFEYLFQKDFITKEELDAMILMTASPDHFLPQTSAVIHGKLGFKQDMLCLDITQGCCGFVVGLIEAFSLLSQPAINKVALVTADVLSRKVSQKDRNSYPLVGDAASITIIEKTTENHAIFANFKMDGSRCNALQIPAGGFRLPSTPETGIMEDTGDNNFRSKDNLVMDGSAVFNFVMEEVPGLIEALLGEADCTHSDVDYYLFHQPNRFMLEKLADAMNVSRDKMPSNVVEVYGNSSGTTIPAAIGLNLSDEICERTLKICFAGFGVGLTWTSVLMNVGPMKFCETFEYA
ncbi:MAG: 3-oxoacyl-[acyl-carrier-protein] synthase III C-terminal domain-containing protein [Cloacibacillus sp.]